MLLGLFVLVSLAQKNSNMGVFSIRMPKYVIFACKVAKS